MKSLPVCVSWQWPNNNDTGINVWMYYVYWLWLCDRLIHNDVMCDLALAWHRWHCHIWSPINMCGAGLVWVTSVQCQWHPHSHTDDPGHTGPHHGDWTQGQGLPLLLLLPPFVYGYYWQWQFQFRWVGGSFS